MPPRHGQNATAWSKPCLTTQPDGTLVLTRPQLTGAQRAILTASDVTVQTRFGRRRSVPRARVTAAVLVEVLIRFPRFGLTVVPLLLLLGDDGRPSLHITAGTSSYYLQSFAEALQVPLDVRQRQMWPGEVRREFPRSLPWYWSHPHVAASLIALAASAIMLAIGLVR
jgi:hypothetical protein